MAANDAIAVRDTAYKFHELDDIPYWRWCSLVWSWQDTPPEFMIQAAKVGYGKYARDKDGELIHKPKHSIAKPQEGEEKEWGDYDDLVRFFGAPVKVPRKEEK